MSLTGFDHVNVVTSDLEAVIDWYDRVLGLKAGARPDFGFPGAWLYLGDLAIVHLAGVDSAPKAMEPRIEHFALRAHGLKEWRQHLAREGVAVTEAAVPGFGVLQLNIHDPDGDHIHVDFDLAREDAA